jgi:ABC-2 type transport system ATP-binding protein
VISVSNLTKKFGENRAVDSLSFDVRRGEIFGIVGPDGAGKSTLLRMMAGITIPAAGEILIDGMDVARNRFRIKESLAYMPQRFGLYEDLTVEENIRFFGRLFGVPRKTIDERTPKLYEFSRLGPFRERLAGNLSGGMKQKLGLACCLIHSPGLILLDEPTNGVDPVSRREFWKILYDLLSDGVTIVVSTAYLDEAERCNRVALMHEGRFIRLGTPAEVKGSVPGALIEIETDDIWRAEEALNKSGEFSGIIREGKTLKVFVRNRRSDTERIRSILSKSKTGKVSVKEKVPNLENCFMEIVMKGEKYESA